MLILAIVATVCVSFSFSVHGLATPCPTRRLTASSGEFMIAGYPNSLYRNGRKCRFMIKAEPGHFVEINFTKFELESPHNKGKRTGFVKIIDGFAKHPAQFVHYDGIRKTPFTFVSQTRRATVVFMTNGRNRGRGFHATYRQIIPVLIDPVYCVNPVIENWLGECEREDGKKLYDYCNITCDSDFQLVGNKTTKCNTDIGEWTDLPRCAMRLDILEICLKDIKNEDCLYSADLLTDHYMKETPDEDDEKRMVTLIEELGDKMRDFDVEDVPSVITDTSDAVSVEDEVSFRRTNAKQVTCPSYLCTYNSSTSSFVYSCLTLSFAAQKQSNLSEDQRKNWMVLCFQCQDNGCGTIQIFL